MFYGDEFQNVECGSARIWFDHEKRQSDPAQRDEDHINDNDHAQLARNWLSHLGGFAAREF